MTVTAQEKIAGTPEKTSPAPRRPPPAEPLVPASGLVDLRDGHSFLRTAGYRAAPADLQLPQSLVRQYGLRTGDLVAGAARSTGQSARAAGQSGGGASRTGASRTGGPRPQRQALAAVETVNGEPAKASPARPRFDELTPLYPQERLRLDMPGASPTARIIDLVSPIGKGQRGLIVAPPKAGKTMVLKAIATAIAAGHPAAHLMIVLVGERPEEVTDLRRTVRGEVIYSTFDQTAADHIMVAELAVERAKRMAESGHDVVVLLDSLTRLGRAYNLAAPPGSRVLTGGVATSALQPPRQFLGAARNIEEGGSLTILSTVLVETGSQQDTVLFEELKGTGNLELRLRRDLAGKRLFPAVDVAASSTRRDDLLMPRGEYAAACRLRRALAGLDPQQAMELLLSKTAGTSSNLELLHQVQRAA